VFETHGFHGLADHLHARQREGDFAGMAAAVTDDVLDNYIVEANWSDLGGALVDRYRGLAPNVRIMTYTASQQLASDPDVLDKWSDVARFVNEHSDR